LVGLAPVLQLRTSECYFCRKIREEKKENFFLFYHQTYFVSISFVEKQNPTKAFLVDQDKGVGKKVSTLFKPIADR